MNQLHNTNKQFVAYDYKEIECPYETASWLVNGYQSFGWEQDTTLGSLNQTSTMKILLRRNRKIDNKVELTRLQQHFESCANEIDKLQQSTESMPTIMSILVGILGTACMAGATFAITADHPMVVLCVLLAIPGFFGWISPIFFKNYLKERKQQSVEPLIEQKKDEVDIICEKGIALL